MINWRLFKYLLNNHIIVILISIIIILVAFFVGFASKYSLYVPVNENHINLQKISNAVALFCGFGYYFFFLTIGDRARSLMAYDYHYMMPNFRLELLKIIGLLFLTYLLFPLLILLSIESISMSHIIVITVICLITFMSNLLNQTIANLISLGSAAFVLTGFPDSSNIQYELQFKLILLISCITLSLTLLWMLLRMPRQYFGISKGKARAESRNVDPILTQSRVLLFIRQKVLSSSYHLTSSIRVLKGDLSILFWNYQFTSLITLRLSITFVAILFLISENSSLIEFLKDSNGLSTKTEPVETNFSLVTSMKTIFVLLLSFFAIFDGSKLATYEQTTRFSWLRLGVDGTTSFVKSVYLSMLKITLYEVFGSLVCFLIVLSSLEFKFFDIALLVLAFFTIKIGNISLMKMLISTKHRRWIWLATLFFNLILFSCIAFAINQSYIDVIIAMSLTLLITILISITYMRKQFILQSTKSLLI